MPTLEELSALLSGAQKHTIAANQPTTTALKLIDGVEAKPTSVMSAEFVVDMPTSLVLTSGSNADCTADVRDLTVQLPAWPGFPISLGFKPVAPGLNVCVRFSTAVKPGGSIVYLPR